MGEIKSTIEIIMEKTKGMTMSEKEEKEFKLREIRGRVGGLIQKFIDGVIDLEKYKIKIASLEKGQRDMIPQAVMNESIQRIRPGGNNTSILELLEVTNGIDAAPIRALLADFEKMLEDQRAEVEREMVKRLHAKGISGSAVIPNPDSDPEWIRYLSQKGCELKEHLSSLGQ